MKVAILGSGAIGGIAGIYMSLNGEDVTFIDNNKEHVVAMREKGIIVDGCRGHFELPPQKAFTPDELTEPLEAVFLATKIQHTESAVNGIKHLLKDDSFVVSLQNGFNEELIASIIGENRTIGALPDYGGAYLEPGHFEYVHEGPAYVGELDHSITPRIKELQRLLSFNTKCNIANDIYARTWAKAIYGSQVVASSLVDEPIYHVLSEEITKRVSGSCVRELLQLALKLNVNVPGGDFFEPELYLPKTKEDTEKLFVLMDRALEKLSKHQEHDEEEKIGYNYVKKSSGIHWDLVYRKRETEIGTRNKYLQMKSKEANMEIPLNTKLFSMIFEIEQGKRTMGWANMKEMNAYIEEMGAMLP